MKKFTAIENSGKAYVYEHWRPDEDRPFWVGKGTTFRYRVYKRNPHYNNIVAKLRSLRLNVEVRFVATGLTDAEAYRIEVERLAYWRGRGVELANKATGGIGGMSGIRRTVESRAKQSKTTRGRKLSPEHRAKIAERVRSPEWRMSVSARHTGCKRPPETGIKISATLRAIGHRPPPPAKGTTPSDETRSKLRAAKTPEVRALLSERVSAKWREPGERERRSTAMSRVARLRRGEAR